MINKLFKYLCISIVIAVIIWIGLGFIAYWNGKNSVDGWEHSGRYEVTVRATGQKLYTDKVLDSGGIITITDYYEQVDGKWTRRKGTLPLDSKLFGPIKVRERE